MSTTSTAPAPPPDTTAPQAGQPASAAASTATAPNVLAGRRTGVLLGLGLLGLVVTLGTGLYLYRGGRFPLSIPGSTPPTHVVKVQVAADGIVTLSVADLRAAGLELAAPAGGAPALDPASLRLTLHGEDVPFFVVQDRLVFYGQAPQMPERLYSVANVYWLASGRGAGQAMPERAVAAPAGKLAPSTGLSPLHLEEDKIFQAMSPERQDPWVWAQVIAGMAITQTFAAPEIAGGEATLRLSVLSVTSTGQNPDHHVVVRLNGETLGEDSWDGAVMRVITLTVPSGLLEPEGNVFSLSTPGDTGALAEVNFLNAVDLTYSRRLVLGDATLVWEPLKPSKASAFMADGAERGGAGAEVVVLDVHDPARPVRLTGLSAEGSESGIAWAFADPAGQEQAQGARYAVAWLDGAGADGVQVIGAREPVLAAQTDGADYLVVAPARFAEPVNALLEWRRSQGLSARQVALEDVFDAYSGGMPDPAAIRDFLRATQERWQPRPRYVLLVGDASYDYRDLLGGPNKSVLPTQLVFTYNSGQTASDVWFTETDAQEPKPQFALGRLPAQTPEQFAVITQKIIAYESAPAGGWSRQVLLAADNDGEFRSVSDHLAESLVPHGMQPDKVYFGQDDLTAAGAHERIMAALNQGVAVANYVGHGSLDVWGDEKALQSADAAQLTNAERLPVLITYTCLNGFFHHPEATSLSETLLWRQGGGIVAAVVPSGRTYTLFQQPLVDGFYEQLFAQSQDARLGDALLAAQRELRRGPGYDDVLLTFNLLGDPALRFVGNR